MVAVFRRGPSKWSHVGRWDLDEGRYQPGAWIAGRIFPRRSDLSPDGRLLCCFVHKPGAQWDHGDSWVAISRMPWLSALHAWGEDGTWTRGWHFTEDGGCDDPRLKALPMKWGLRSSPMIQFAAERRRGWIEAPDSPARDPADAWDQRRNARMIKPRPGGGPSLRLESAGHAGGEFGIDQAIDGMRVRYWLENDDDIVALDDLQWADWDRDGRLLAATRDGHIQVRVLEGDIIRTTFDEDLSALEPDPRPAPAFAREW